MINSSFFRTAVVPAAVFQSVIFGGAYGTGREIAEFVTRHGPIGGLLALFVIAVGFAAILFLCFELARLRKVYDYRTFFKALIGRGWVTFEILFFVAVLLVLAVNGSAAGKILQDQFGIPEYAGIALLFASVVILNYLGRRLLEKSMSFWMIALSLVLVVYCIETFVERGGTIGAELASGEIAGNWLVSGFQYTLYNAAVIPVLLYCARDIETRKQSIVAGIVAGAMGAFPALVFHLTFLANYPAVLDEPLPTYWILGQVASPALFLVYVIVLFGMMIQTVAGLLHGLNERLDAWWVEKNAEGLSSATHATIAGAVLLASMALAQIGITALIARGYGTLAWGYLIVFVIPLFTVGLRFILKSRRQLPKDLA